MTVYETCFTHQRALSSRLCILRLVLVLYWVRGYLSRPIHVYHIQYTGFNRQNTGYMHRSVGTFAPSLDLSRPADIT